MCCENEIIEGVVKKYTGLEEIQELSGVQKSNCSLSEDESSDWDGQVVELNKSELSQNDQVVQLKQIKPCHIKGKLSQILMRRNI